jgi:Fur family ferric uptake transcriptional regulator
VLEVVRAREDHPTADQVYRAVKKRLPRVSLGTVYRNLAVLAGEGRIRVLEGHPRRYEGTVREHLHVRCLGCGGVSDVAAGPVDSLIRKARSGSGYKVLGYRLELVGYCPGCLRRTGHSKKGKELGECPGRSREHRRKGT